MFDTPQNHIELVGGQIAELTKDDTIKPLAIRKPIHWRISDYGRDKLLELYTTGSKSAAGYHIGVIIERQEIHGQAYDIATRLYNNGEPGKSWAQRVAFAKSVIQHTAKGGYIQNVK